MIFNPRSQIKEESTQDTSSTGSLSFLTIPYHLPYSDLQSYCGNEEWQSNLTQEDTTRSTLGSLNMSNVSVSYDIYGNELLLEDEEMPRQIPSQRDLVLESIKEEELMSPDPMVTDQENKDPVLHMITPVKRRGQQQQEDHMSERRSFVINRSPLLDITPGVSKRKCSHQIDTRGEVSRINLLKLMDFKRSFLNNNLTPKSDHKNGPVDIMFTRKFR